MKFIIVSGNPKKDGLTRRMTDEIIRGAKDGGAEVEEINVCNQERCRMCNGGAGKCLSDEHACVFGKYEAAKAMVEGRNVGETIPYEPSQD